MHTATRPPLRPCAPTPSLQVHLEFATAADALAWVEAWGPLAAHCRANEPGCLTYEAAIDDGAGTKVVIMERYTCKDDLTVVHQQSAPFLAFGKNAVQKLVVSKSGQSYFESNVGFTFCAEKGY